MTDQDLENLPFVSVVIPVFNEERYIEACLDSVLGQPSWSRRPRSIRPCG